MTDTAQINLRVDPEQKERWETYLEESNQFVTLSDLIRTSVEAHIQTEHTESRDPSPALASDIQTLHEEVTDVRQNVAWLREQFQEDVDIADLAQAVFDELEQLPDPPQALQAPDDFDGSYDEFEHQARAQLIVDPADPTDDRRPQTAGAIAERVGTTPTRVQDAIDHLQDQFLPVVTVEYDGDIHHFREE